MVKSKMVRKHIYVFGRQDVLLNRLDMEFVSALPRSSATSSLVLQSNMT
jgi:hypothetical protein